MVHTAYIYIYIYIHIYTHIYIYKNIYIYIYKNVFAGKRNFPLNKAKKNKNFFVESLDHCRRLEVREKARNVFLWRVYVCLTKRCYTTSHLHQVFFFDFARIFSLFSLVFRTSNFWSLRNLIKQLFHSRLLDMRLVIANSALRASLAIYVPSHIQRALME